MHLQGGDESNRTYRQGFSGGEMAALGVVAGQAAAALRRLGVEEADREGVLQKLDAAAADRVDEGQVKITRWWWVFPGRLVGAKAYIVYSGFCVVRQTRPTPKYAFHEEGDINPYKSWGDLELVF